MWQVLPGIYRGHELVAGGIWKGDVLVADLEDLEKIYPRRISVKEVLISQKGWRIHIIICRWYSKIVRKRLRIPRIHSKTGTNREERRFQWRTSLMFWESLNRQKPQMTLKPGETLRRYKVTSSVVITLNH